MNFPKATVADVVMCSQRDTRFIEDARSTISSILEKFGTQNFTYLRKITPWITNIWYYGMTSLSNLQTLGEEYTGTLRFTSNRTIPTRTAELLWLLIYVGGEPMYDKFLDGVKAKINETDMSSADKAIRLKYLKFLKDNKLVFMRIHNSMFYIGGTYYNMSNRLTGIKYILLRKWFTDNSATNSFGILGRISCAYLILNLIRQLIAINNSSESREVENVVIAQTSTKSCAICAENRKNTCCTPCGHLFCWDCIYDTLKYQPNCPICRKEFSPSRIVSLQNYF